MSQPTNQGTMWSKTKTYGKKGFDKGWDALDKLGAPVNRLSNKLGSEAFWPMTLDKESEKVARILRSFCKDGVYVEDSPPPTPPPVNGQNGKAQIDRPRGKQKVLKKIPKEVIRDAKGLVIFTAMRTGLWVSGASGSGVLIARIPETGEWSAPSGILMHTAGVGFLVGADIYDCVMVINTYEALEAFYNVRVTLGSEVTVAAGPIGIGGVLESEVHKRRAPIWTYVKSRGFYAGAQVDGSFIIERNDENERFYGRKVPVRDITSGKVRTNDPGARMLTHTVHSAQGDAHFDRVPTGVQAPTGPTPSDFSPSDFPPSDLPPQYSVEPPMMSGANAAPYGPPHGDPNAGQYGAPNNVPYEGHNTGPYGAPGNAPYGAPNAAPYGGPNAAPHAAPGNPPYGVPNNPPYADPNWTPNGAPNGGLPYGQGPQKHDSFSRYA